MKTQSCDTSPEVEKVQFDLLRQAGPQKRLQLARAHTQSAIRIARHRIALAHPDWNERQVALRWAEITYGEKLVAEVRAHLQKRGDTEECLAVEGQAC